MKKIIWLSLLLVNILVLLAVPVSLLAQTVEAQEVVKSDLVLRVLPGDFYNGITPGVTRRIFIEARNNGSRTLTDIRFSSNAPEGWTVVFSPDRLESLAVGTSYAVDVDIVPSGTSERGDYTLSLIADASETRAVTSVFLRVEGGSGYWLWIGVGIAVVVAIGFIIVFLRESKK